MTSQPDYDPDNPPAKQKELEAEIDKLVYRFFPSKLLVYLEKK